MKSFWLDCDPGHDDAVAILLAAQLPEVNLLGVSTVHGNADAECTKNNAARSLYAFAAKENVKVYPGASKPLMRPPKHDPEIHGADGLGGVEGLPPATHPDVQRRLVLDEGAHQGSHNAISGMAAAVRAVWKSGEIGGEPVTLVSTGPMTNIALFVSVYPELLEGIEQIVFMGGGVGMGNRSATSEFNILCDPEAAQIALNAPVKTVMIPINVTHTAIATDEIMNVLRGGSVSTVDSVKAASPLRHMLCTLIGFFAETYRSTFGFTRGPPLHDALAVAYVADPDLFTALRFRVDVECSGTLSSGQTVVDVWNYTGASEDSWGVVGKNCLVTQSLDVPKFFQMLLDCVERCDRSSPLNNK